jgi:UDP:flavonoid glycosyltransferase YjiC (YdhE family)
MMAIALGLQERGYRVTIAASDHYRMRIELEGIGFHSLGPKMDMQDTRIFEEVFDPVRGPERLIRKYMMPYVRQTYEELKSLVDEADFLLNSTLIFPGPLLAEKRQIPWASVGLQPFLYLSAYDPPTLPQLPFTESWYAWPTGFWKVFLRLLTSTTHSWSRPIDDLCSELGLPSSGNPLFEGQFSPYLNLAVFSSLVGAPQPDWPANTHATGFAFYDRMKPDEQELPSPLRRFLEAGDPPVVFTLGSSAVHTAGAFYEISMKVANSLGYRALLLAGENRLSDPITDRILVWDYADYSKVFPYAAAVVHQGGMGTTAQVLRAQKPMVAVPFGFDQHDNAARMKRLGVSRTIHRKQYRFDYVAMELSHLLNNPVYSKQATEVGSKIQAEDGVVTSCNLIENFL